MPSDAFEKSFYRVFGTMLAQARKKLVCLSLTAEENVGFAGTKWPETRVGNIAEDKVGCVHELPSLSQPIRKPTKLFWIEALAAGEHLQVFYCDRNLGLFGRWSFEDRHG